MVRQSAVALALAASLVPGAAGATQELTPEPGLSYRVVDVAEGDVLNVRAQAGTQADVVATLAPGTTGVVVSGVRLELSGSVWWRVMAEGRTGWVNARHLTPEAPEAERAWTFPLACVGTEPFWSLSVDGSRAVLSAPDAPGRQWRAEEARVAPNPGFLSIRLNEGAAVGHLAALRSYDFCSDGMSDLQYPYHVLVDGPDGVVRSGCCARGG